MKSERIAQRQDLKAQLKNLKARLAASRPLMEAEAQLRNVYMKGFRAGLQEAVNKVPVGNPTDGVDRLVEQPPTEVVHQQHASVEQPVEAEGTSGPSN